MRMDRGSSKSATSTPQKAPTQIDKMKNADWLRHHHGGTYKKIKNLRWVKDSLTQEEAETTQDLLYLAANDHETLERVLALQWIEDSITQPESKAIQHLMYLSYRDKDTSRKLAGMPFLESVTEADALLIDGLHGRWHRGTLAGFMKHPIVVDGITEAETVRAVAATTIDDEGHLARILNPGSATVETIQTSSPRTTNLKISIVRAGNRRATDTSLVIEDAAKCVENAMGMPLPTNHVIVLLDDTGVLEGFAGANYGQAIAYLREGEDGDKWQRAAFRKGMVHEVAHYFWRNNEAWVNEGIANTVEHNYGREAGLSPRMMTTQQKGCTTTTLQALSALAPETHSPQFQCNYYLGEKIFLDLQNAQGVNQFRNGLRKLYQMSITLRKEDRKAGIAQVRAAFRGNEAVIEKHWSDKSIATSRPTLTPTPPSSTTNPTPGTHIVTNRNPGAYTNFRPDANTNAHSNSGAYTNFRPDANSNSYRNPGTHTHADPSGDAIPYS